MHVLGIDAGGTKTVCLLADAQGDILAEARAAGANLQTAGPAAVERVLTDVVGRVLNGSPAPAAVCVGIAGGDRPRDMANMRAILRDVGFTENVLVVNDALVALTAGVGDAPGLVIVSGTGSIAYGRDAQGRAARAGGWGHVLGDEGSGFWLGRAALTAAAREDDGRGPRTRLTPIVLDILGLDSVPDLIPLIYEGGVEPAAIARLAAAVQRAAGERDPVACALIESAAGQLVDAAAAVLGRLDMQDATFTTVLAGGAFRSMPSLRDEVRRRLAAIAPRSDVRLLDAEPARGAVHMALAHARGASALPRLV